MPSRRHLFVVNVVAAIVGGVYVSAVGNATFWVAVWAAVGFFTAGSLIDVVRMRRRRNDV